MSIQIIDCVHAHGRSGRIGPSSRYQSGTTLC